MWIEHCLDIWRWLLLSDPFDDFHDLLASEMKEDMAMQQELKEFFTKNPRGHVEKIRKHEMDASDYFEENGQLLHKETKQVLTINQKDSFTNKLKHVILSGALGPHPLLEQYGLIYKDGALITNREGYRED